MSDESWKPGLEGTVAAETQLTAIDGQAGEFLISGFPVEEIAPSATFEEMVYLLWNGAAPDPGQLDDFGRRLRSHHRSLAAPVLSALREAAAAGLPVIDALRAAIDCADTSVCVSPRDEAEFLVSLAPLVVGTYWRLVREAPLEPVQGTTSGLSEHYLRLLSDEPPSRSMVRALDTYWNTMVDHGLNASTFAARVIVSTRADMKSAIVGALGALKGPLHGGAPGPALQMLSEIGEAENAEPYIRRVLERGERLMGFGHRVYKVRDPRAEVLSQAASDLYKGRADTSFLELAGVVEEIAVSLLEEHKPGRDLHANAEFYTSILLHGLGLPEELFTATFAVARVAGWTAHCLEQQAVDRIFRPASVYCGPERRAWAPREVG